jgi:uncharacterized protein (TIGR03435 family)
MRSLTAASLAVLASCLAVAQDAATKPAFEVASVKPSPPQGGPMGIGLFTYPGGRIHATSYTLRMLIHDAYNLEMYKILGGPRWADDDRFDVEAKPPASSESSKFVPANFKSPPNPEMRQMLQALLAERFQLKVHTETRKESVYALVVAKGGPKLKQPASTTVQPFVSFFPHGLSGENATMDQLVERMATIFGRPVLNHTGIQGNFDFLIDYPPDDAATDRTVLLLSAIQVQIGLKLETQPGSIDVIVIDRAEKPSRN